MLSKVKYDYLLLIIAIIWCLFFSFTIQLKPGYSPLGDDYSYLYAARLLYYECKLDNTRPLLISLIQGVPFVFGFSDSIVIKWGIFINFFSWFCTALLLFKIISKKVNRKKAFVFSLLFIFCIGNLAHAFNFLSESIFIFLIVYSLYYVNKFYESSKYYYITIAISILLFNTLIKPVSIGLALILFSSYILKFNKVILNKFSFLLFTGIALIFFQMYSLKKNYGDFTISYIGSITYYNYLGDKADCYKNGLEYVPGKTERAKKISKVSSHEMKRIAENDLKDQLKNNTFNLFKAYLFCIYSNTHKGNYIVSQCDNKKNTCYFKAFYIIYKSVSKIQNIVFTIVGVILSIFCFFNYKRTDRFFLITATFILFIFLISALSCYQCDRFHIAFFPLLMILSSGLIKKTNKNNSDSI